MDKKIVTDLDGVLRDLNGYLHTEFDIPIPKQWKWKHEGKTIFQWIKENPHVLTDSPVTKYFSTIMDFFGDSKFEIWTNQPQNWRVLTQVWLKLHLADKNYEVFYLTKEEKYARLISEPNALLIEDHPQFESYDRIILIDTTYNQDVDAKMRVKTPEELKILLNKEK